MDASTLAHAVRRLAPQAHRLLREPDRQPSDLAALTARLAELERTARQAGHEPVHRWASNLMVEVQRGAPDRSEPDRFPGRRVAVARDRCCPS